MFRRGIGVCVVLKISDIPGFRPFVREEGDLRRDIINGKFRAKLELPADADKDAIEQAALADENVIKFTSNKPPKKVIYVPKKLVNIVV